MKAPIKEIHLLSFSQPKNPPVSQVNGLAVLRVSQGFTCIRLIAIDWCSTGNVKEDGFSFPPERQYE
ncbi:UNVERIFIED_CONTAM: hypothetical protein FKN15_040237 [Acipenser sinensis]